MGETDLLLEVGNYQVSQDGTLSVVNGYEPNILLDFNVDGNIWDLM